MSVNGITSTNTDAYSSYQTTTPKTSQAAKNAEAATSDNTAGVVYEASKQEDSTKKIYSPNTELVARLKADAESRSAQLQSIVQQMLSKQGTAYGQANDMWSILSSGDFTVDASTKAQAQADIAEDGYWGVKQTSSRILDFATALTGGDPDKIEEMRTAFQKGYEQAQKTWGGELPEISKQTYDAVLAGFDQMAQANAITE